MTLFIANGIKFTDISSPFRTASKLLFFSGLLLFGPQWALAQANPNDCPANKDCEVSFDLELNRASEVWEVRESNWNHIEWVTLKVGDGADGNIDFEVREVKVDGSIVSSSAKLETRTSQLVEKAFGDHEPHAVDGDFQIWHSKGAIKLTVKNGKVSGGRALNPDSKNEVGILIINDNTVEPTEHFDIVLTNPTGNITFPGGARELIQRVEIKENSDGLDLDVKHSGTVVEGQSARFELSLERELNEGEYAHVYVYTNTEIIINPAHELPASPADYARIPVKDQHLITWGSGQRTRTFLIPTTDDDIDEEPETFVLTVNKGLASGVNITKSYGNRPNFRVIIEDNDPTPVISVPSISVLEGGYGERTSMVFQVRLDRPRDKIVTVDYNLDNAAGTAKVDDDYVKGSELHKTKYQDTLS